jgi:hypothetical protein
MPLPLAALHGFESARLLLRVQQAVPGCAIACSADAAHTDTDQEGEARLPMPKGMAYKE